MHILGKIVRLRAVEESDLEKLHYWANDPVTQDLIGPIHFPSSMDFHQNWFQKLKNDPLNLRFVIELPDKKIIGLSSLMNIDWRNRHAWHGVMIGAEEARGQGHGLDAIMATMRYAFDELHLERLDGSMIETNKASRAVYCSKFVGWKEEGIRRNYFFRKGRYWDQILVGITRADYDAVIGKTKYWD